MIAMGIRGAALGLSAMAALAARSHALDVDVSFSGDGKAALVRVLHSPAREPLAAVRFRLKLKADAGAASLTASKPQAGPWSQFLPSASFDGRSIAAFAMAPATGSAGDSAAREVARFEVAFSPRTAPQAATDLIDSVSILEAYGPDGKSVALRARLTTGLAPRRAAAEAPAFSSRGASRTLAFNLGRAQRVRAWISDAAGRRVANVLDRKLPAGIQEVTWDGNAKGGRPPAPGTYLFHLESSAFRYDRKVEVAP